MRFKVYQVLTVIITSFIFTGVQFCTAQDFYNESQIQVIQLNFMRNDWDQALDSLRNTGDGEGRLIASVTINGTLFNNVGVRYKGFSSYNQQRQKNGFSIKLNYTDNNSNYQGYENVKLSTEFRDPSYIREVLSYNIIRKYTPASKANFAKVYVNGAYHGLFTNVEAIDEEFLRKRFGNGQNTLIKAGANNNWLTPNPAGCSNSNISYTSLQYIGNDSSCYKHYYENKSTSASAWNDLINLTTTIQNNPGNIENVLDVDQALWVLAFNNATVNLDSYSGKYMHNYYLYKDKTGRFQLLIWDLNQSFGSYNRYDFGVADLSISDRIYMNHLLQQNSQLRVLLNLLLNNSYYRKKYESHIKTIIQENFNNYYYTTQANFYHNLVQADVIADPNHLYDYSTFQNSLGYGTLVTDYPQNVTYEVPGIFQLMEGRKVHLSNQSFFNNTSPVIANTRHYNLSNLPNSTVINTTVSNATSVSIKYCFGVYDKFATATMYDDGMHNDGNANDGTYGAYLPKNEALVKYYIEVQNSNTLITDPKNAEYAFHFIKNPLQPNVIVINEFMASNINYNTDPQGQNDDWIELHNTSQNTVSLNGLYMSDDATNPLKWPLPDANIAAGGYLIIWADKDEANTGMHASFSLDKNGDEIILANPDSTYINYVSFGPQQNDVSQARIPNGLGNFHTTTPTFNANNTVNNLAPIVPYQTIRINELMAVNAGNSADPSGEYEDWVELYNPTSNPIKLHGMYLSDDRSMMNKWPFPDVTIAPNGFTIIWLDNEINEPGIHANFKLAQAGGGLYLSNTNLSLIDSVFYNAQPTNISWARIPNGTGNFRFTGSSFYLPNVVGNLPSNVGNNLVINEFVAKNNLLPDPQGEYEDWIEIYNKAGYSINLENYYLTDDYNNPYKWRFPSGSIPAFGYVIVWADNDENQTGYHANFKLAQAGDRIKLTFGVSNFLDSIQFGTQFSDTALARFPNGVGSFGFAHHTFSNFNSNSPLFTPLPIELGNFILSENNCDIRLDWTTLTEQNTANFYIERSFDGKYFDRIAKIAAAGNSNSEIEYSYTDNNSVEGFTNYYRLQTVDFDGTIGSSPVESLLLNCHNNANVYIYPNPTNGILNYELTNMEKGEVTIGITDITGKSIWNDNFVSDGDMTGILNVNDLRLAPGIYIFNVKNNARVQHLRFTVK